MNIIPAVAITASIIASLAGSFWYLGRDGLRIHGEIVKLKEQAKAAMSAASLQVVRHDLVMFYNRSCWHRSHGDHVREVLAYIDGRLSAHIPEGSNGRRLMPLKAAD